MTTNKSNQHIKKVITSEIEKKIISLRKNKKIGAPAIAKELGISRAPVGKYLKKAIEEGIISRLEYNDYKNYKKLKRYKERPKIHNTIHKVNPLDKCPIWAKYKIQFSVPKEGTETNIPKKFEGIQFFKNMENAKIALKKRFELSSKLLSWNYEDMLNNTRAISNQGNTTIRK